MIKAVIFDLDGVLVHTDRFHFMAWKRLADELNIPFDEVFNQRLRGLSRMDSLDEILKISNKLYSVTEKNLLAERKNSTYKSLIANMTPSDVTQEVLNTLEVLRQRRLYLAVGSSSKNAYFILEKTGLYPCFDAVADGTMIAHAKPDPEVFLKAAGLLGVAPGEAVVVEDARAGIMAAKTGGFMAIAVGEARSCKLADAALDRFLDLPELLTCFKHFKIKKT
ncbi:MAG TPA: beta-phosphoglucomutase [Clostridia bacterium]|nr:beta-phosphoglucomutase [Clostridia bacterium]